MIPLKMQLKNFVSYGAKTQTVSFEPYQLICLSGKNGHGKSALLDALTWALWGQARKNVGMTKADDAVLRLGQTNMFVALDFSCAGQNYRVRREYLVSGHKATTSLELGIIDSNNILKPLTDKTIKTTQDKINSILGIDYDAFINSAFLRQGHSNEFSKKSPKDRKEILASILRLDQFEKIKKRASEKSKEAQNLKEQLMLTQADLSSFIEKKSSLHEQLATIQAELGQLLKQELANTHKTVQLKDYTLHILDLRKQHEIATFKIGHVDQKFNELLASCTDEIDIWRLTLKHERTAINYQQVQHELALAEQRIQELQAQAHNFINLKESYLQLRESQNNCAQQVSKKMQAGLDLLQNKETSIRVLLSQVGEQLKESDSRLEFSARESEKYQQEYTRLTSIITSYQLAITTQLEEQLEKNKAYYHRWVARSEKLAAELQNMQDKIDLTQSSQQPQCPLCQQDLSPEHKERMLREFTAQEMRIKIQIARLNKAVSYIKIKIQKQLAAQEIYKKQVVELQSYKIKQEEIAKHQEKIALDIVTLKSTKAERVEAHAKLGADLEELIQQIARYRESHTIEADPKYKNIAAKLDELQQQIKSLAYNPEHEKQAHQKLITLQNMQKEHVQIQTQIAGQHMRKQRIAESVLSLKQYKQEKKELATALAQLADLDQKEQALRTEEQNLGLSIAQLQQKKETAMLNKGACEQELKTFELKETEFISNRKKLEDCQRHIDEYQAISSALGKDGIQALLIEDVIPEIEREANKLLARLTDNQAHLSIESLRDLRSGGTKETLDIKISDAIGIRPYELFSGGEAFRIDFALRIAISKLLAHRAGTALQTLIIDEGFGSQDEEGLTHIMDAILKIQEDFAKIIVVSHLPGLKDQFPVHFYIHKGPDGSQIKIIEND